MFIVVSTLGNLIYNGKEGSERTSQINFREGILQTQLMFGFIKSNGGGEIMMKSRLLVWAAGEMALPDITNGP